MAKENKDFNSEYDIPDDPRPKEKEKEESSKFDLIYSDIEYKKSMVNFIQRLRNKALKLIAAQELYWEKHGDEFYYEPIANFVESNKEIIIGIVKDAKWLVKSKYSDWDKEFMMYFNTLKTFTKRSQYVISKYQKSIENLYEELEGK